MMASVCICVVATCNLASLFKHHGVIEHLQSPYGAVQFIKLTGTGGVFSRTMCPDCSLLHCSFLCLGAAGTRTAPDIPQQARKKEACDDRNCKRSQKCRKPFAKDCRTCMASHKSACLSCMIKKTGQDLIQMSLLTNSHETLYKYAFCNCPGFFSATVKYQ